MGKFNEYYTVRFRVRGEAPRAVLFKIRYYLFLSANTCRCPRPDYTITVTRDMYNMYRMPPLYNIIMYRTADRRVCNCVTV